MVMFLIVISVIIISTVGWYLAYEKSTLYYLNGHAHARAHARTRTHTHTFNGPFPGLPG